MKTKNEFEKRMESNEMIPAQTYSKSQLASLYLPDIQTASARRTLRSWVAKNEQLKQALTLTGYHTRAILLTPAQVGLFFEYLGRP